MPRFLPLLILSLWAGPALACNCVRFSAGNPRFERDVAAAVDGAIVVAEGVIVRPMGPLLEPALFRPTRILKGPVRESYEIGIVSDCGLLLREADVKPGEPIRLILHGGPEVYEAMRCVNFLGEDFDKAVARQLAACKGR